MSKYKTIKTVYKSITYDSKKEAGYAQQLDICKNATDEKERVVHIDRQPEFECKVNGKKICKYRADFKVFYADGTMKIIDVKGFKTPVYKLKKKLVEALHNIEIIEV